jgi:general secretion pathway protein C
MESKSRISAKLLLISNLALSGLIGLVLAELIITFLQNREETQTTVQVAQAAPPRQPSQLGTRTRPNDFRPILARDIFKTHQDAEASPRPVAKTIEPTKLDLRLKGTVVGEDAPAFAVIQDGKTREQNIYRVGDVVSGARITGITWDDVILDVERKQEALHLEEDASTGTAPSPQKPLRKSPRRTRKKAPPPPPSPPSE